MILEKQNGKKNKKFVFLFFKQIGGGPSSSKYGEKPPDGAKPLDTIGITGLEYPQRLVSKEGACPWGMCPYFSTP